MRPDRTQQPYYEPGVPVLHRAGVTAADAGDPVSPEGAVSSAGYERVRFDLDTTGSVALMALRVQVLFWNPLAGCFFHGDEREMTEAELLANPKPSLDAQTRGASAVFLKVVSAQAAVLTLDVYATPW
jgi:hypothetical protein